MLCQDDLLALIDRIWPTAQTMGLDLDAIHFELMPASVIVQLAAQGGMPVRYRHWSFGKGFQNMKARHDYQLGMIYELVINSEPNYVFVDRGSSREQALVIIAHVLGHVDFFRQNAVFQQVPKDMMNRMAYHRKHVNKTMAEQSEGAVESLLDAGHVLMDFCGNSLAAFPSNPGDSSDVLGYIIRHATSLVPWERSLLAMLHEEARYFWPQMLTKVSNEGYASFWHRHILWETDLSPVEQWESARFHASIMQSAPGYANPYQLGSVIFEDIYARSGVEGVFATRQMIDDVGLIRDFFSPKVFETLQSAQSTPDAQFSSHRTALMRRFDHAGLPYISVEGTDPQGTLVLRHHYEGRDLEYSQLPHALRILAERLWRGPVELHTKRQNINHVARHDGKHWSDTVSAFG